MRFLVEPGCNWSQAKSRMGCLGSDQGLLLPHPIMPPVFAPRLLGEICLCLLDEQSIYSADMSDGLSELRLLVQ